MKKLSLLLALLPMFYGAQNAAKRQTQGFYVAPEASLGFNLSNMIKSNRDRENDPDYLYHNAYPNDFSYGFSAVAGYNFIPNLALGGGLKYTYIADNYHLIYGIIQPKVIFNPDDEPVFIDLTYGFQLNRSAVKDADFFGIKLGKQISYSKRLSQQGGLYFEGQQLGSNGTSFIGLFYGITVFSNKNYTEYGKDQN